MFIGGAAVAGGIGTVISSIIGGLVMAFLNNGLALLGQGADVVSMIKGLVLLLAVGIDVWNKHQGWPSVICFLTRRFGRKQNPAAEMFEPCRSYPTAQNYGAPTVHETRGK